jgi:thioredoxin-related protein
MFKYVVSSLALTVVVTGLFAFRSAPKPADPTPMRWYTWEEAVELNKSKPKKIFVDVYTDWCGWCKKMDKSTFVDPAVMAYMTEHFYPVKLNAEQKEDIVFNGETFKYVTQGSRGVHTLAYALLDGQMSYPSFVTLNEKFERIMISPGYKEAPDMLKELKFSAEEQYTKTTWEEYRKSR